MNGWMDDDIETKELAIFLRLLKTWLVDIIDQTEIYSIK